MQRGAQVAIKLLVTVLGLLVVTAVIYAAVKVFPLYAANWKFKEAMFSYARVIHVEPGSTDRLHDAIYREAQRDGIPLDSQNIKVEVSHSGTQVTADYTAPIDLPFFQPQLIIHVQYPDEKQLFSPFNRFSLSSIGLILGIFWFFKGFAFFWKYRIIADTPLAPIRGVAMGLVQIRGKAVGEKTLTSPISNQACFLYKVDIDRWSAGRGGSGRWSHYLADVVGVNFYLEDESGRVLIDPLDAEYDLHETCKSEVSKSEYAMLGQMWKTEEQPGSIPGLPVSQTDLRSYVRQVESGVYTGLSRGKDWPARGAVKPRRVKPRRGIMYWFNLLFNSFLVAQQGPLAVDYGHSPGDYRLTEYCISPEEMYDITGTCTPNPGAKEGSDQQLITKGANDPTFLISNQSEKDLENTLRGRARLHIFGGGLLAVGCAAALLETIGLLF